MSEKMSNTPRLNKVLALAEKEARALNHKYVGTEHVLMGILQDGSGLVHDTLKDHGITLELASGMVKPVLSQSPTCDLCEQKAGAFLTQIVKGKMEQKNFCAKHYRIWEITQHLEELIKP